MLSASPSSLALRWRRGPITTTHAPRRRRTRPAFMPHDKAQHAPASTLPMPSDALKKSVAEFEHLAFTAPDSNQVFAVQLHDKLLTAVMDQVGRVGCTLRPARTEYSDANGQFVRRSKDGGMVLYTQVGALPAGGTGHAYKYDRKRFVTLWISVWQKKQCLYVCLSAPRCHTQPLCGPIPSQFHPNPNPRPPSNPTPNPNRP